MIINGKYICKKNQNNLHGDHLKIEQDKEANFNNSIVQVVKYRKESS